jgi:hypothetical protein
MKQSDTFTGGYSVLRRHFEQLPPARKMEFIRNGGRVVDKAEPDTRRPPLPLSFSQSEWRAMPEAERENIGTDPDLHIYKDEWADEKMTRGT